MIQAFSAALVMLMLTSCLTAYQPEENYRALLRPFASADSELPIPAPEFATPERLTVTAVPEVQGSLAQRIEVLLTWMGPQIVTDGAMKPFTPFTADQIWLEGKKGRGLNCRAVATLFASVLESSGIASRVLFLYSRDLSDENHVVVLAWDPDSQRWLFVDPSYRTLLIGEDQKPLDLEQVWLALYQGRPWTYSSKASWNGGPFDLDHRHYLSKNLYRMVLPGRGQTFIQLLPPGSFAFGPPWGSSRTVHSFAAFLTPP